MRAQGAAPRLAPGNAADTTARTASPDGLGRTSITRGTVPATVNEAPPDDADLHEFLAERAAIAEYDGGLDRDEAERQARNDAIAKWPQLAASGMEFGTVEPLEAPTEDVPPLEAYADEPGATADEKAVTLADFFAYMPQHLFVFVPTRQLWPAASVNARVPPIPVGAGKPIKASAWLDEHRAVEQMTWAPGRPMVVEDRLISAGDWIDRPGCRTFNLYLPPQPIDGDATQAGKWLDHIRYIYPEEANHIIRWLAHRVQRPGEKINHAIVLGGAQGIGKDSLLEPVKFAVGPWNVEEVSPTQLMGRFNGFQKSVILRVSEARDQGDAGGGKIDRYAVYEHCKTLTAAPPNVLRVDEKNLREYCVMNVCGVVFTTNHKDGLYLPPDDRRHYVAWSERTKEDFVAHYWRDLYAWYNDGGIGHVAAYLGSVDLAGFDPKAPPPKTSGWHRMVDAGRAPEDAALSDALDGLQNPAAVTVSMLCGYADDSLREWLRDRRNSRQIPHRMEAAGYVAVRNDADKRDGQWKVDGRRQTIYARRTLPLREQLAAAAALSRRASNY